MAAVTEVSVPLQVELVSADHTVWSGEASLVVARTADGDLGVMPGHTPIFAVLSPGQVRITPPAGEAVVASVGEGFLSVDHDRVTILSDAATLGSGSESH